MNAVREESTGRDESAQRHPLGPLVYRYRPLEPRRSRWWAAAVLAACSGVLFIAASIKPDPSGVGTHRQLRLDACGMFQTTGVPCPTCGMTTAFAHTVRGQLIAGFRAQPFGLILAITTVLLAIVSFDTVTTRYCWALNWYRIRPSRFVIVLGALMIGAWAWKVVSVIGIERLWSPS